MYKYETHLHTYPVSACAKYDVRLNLEFYKNMGYDGVFITNHFLNGNINIDSDMDFSKKIDFYLSDYYTAKSLENEIGIKVFFGIEYSYKGTDFLIYGLTPEWYINHPEFLEMPTKQALALAIEEGALVIHAHPFREAGYIDHKRLFPRSVHGVEIINACRTDFENDMAKDYADNYKLLYFAGSDNHIASNQKLLSGVSFETPLVDELDFVKRVKNNQMGIFVEDVFMRWFYE